MRPMRAIRLAGRGVAGRTGKKKNNSETTIKKSPDTLHSYLNPIQQVWGKLETKLNRSAMHVKENPWLKLQKAWENISDEVNKKLTPRQKDVLF